QAHTYCELYPRLPRPDSFYQSPSCRRSRGPVSKAIVYWQHCTELVATAVSAFPELSRSGGESWLSTSICRIDADGIANAMYPDARQRRQSTNARDVIGTFRNLSDH